MDRSYKSMANLLLGISMVMAIVITYYRSYYLWMTLGCTNSLLHSAVGFIYRKGLLEDVMIVKLMTLLSLLFTFLVNPGRAKQIPYRRIVTAVASGLLLFLGSEWILSGPLSVSRCMSYVVLGLSGYVSTFAGLLMLGRRIGMMADEPDDEDDTFRQCEEKIENEYSVNIPMVYQWKGRRRSGWINVVNPFRATLVIGIPGSGKSYSVYGPYIHQMIRKGYSMFVYDYKYPDLTQIVYNELMDNIGCYKVRPSMYCVNFDDPEHSHRFNPIHKDYLKSPADATEVAEIIMLNVNKGAENKEDFFSQSAKSFVDMLIWYLRVHMDGIYCTFPHLIALMGQDYRDVFALVEKEAASHPELKIKLMAFADAAKDKAYEQLQGQIASARIPLLPFADPGLSWILSGNDFSLDINDPAAPKIVCVGNNPDRQSIYGTTLALLTSRLFRQINHKGRMHSAVLIDELPTIYLKGLDNLINTGRSNKVAVVIGAQDKSQIIRDYDKQDADVIFNTVGNLFSGAVKGDTAGELSKSFGKELRPAWSHMSGDSSESQTLSYQMREVLPRHRIEALSQGTFCGYIADTHRQKISRKLFCGEILVEGCTTGTREIPQISFFGDQKVSDAIMRNHRRIHQDIEDMITRGLAG